MLTKQGIRDLGGNSQTVRRRCLHVTGPTEVIRYRLFDCFGIAEREAVYGQRCVWCSRVLSEHR